jgi:hypothetical protein
MNRGFGPQSYSLEDVFAEERQPLMQLLCQETLLRLDQLYSQVYRDNYGVLRAFHRDGWAVPQELQVAAEITLSQRTLEVLRKLDRETSDPDTSPLGQGEDCLNELDAIAMEASCFQARLSLASARPMLERLVWRSLWQLLHSSEPQELGLEGLTSGIEWLGRLIKLADQLGLGLCLDRPQELYYQYLHRQVFEQLQQAVQSAKSLPPDQHLWIQDILGLGECLCIDVAGARRVLAQL